MPKPKPAPVTAQTPVPYAPGVTYGQLCHVRRRYEGVIGPGTILGYPGAWDRKGVVSHVVYGGSCHKHGYTYHVFTVGIVSLGKFFADGRLEPALRLNTREIQLETTNGCVGSFSLKGWCAVEVFVPPVKGQEALTTTKGAEYHYNPTDLPLACANGPDLQQVQAALAAAQAAKVAELHAKMPGGAGKSPTPEAVLAEFLIKDPYADLKVGE